MNLHLCTGSITKLNFSILSCFGIDVSSWHRFVTNVVVGTSEWTTAVIEIAKLIFIQMCNSLWLWIRKVVKCCKPDLMGHPSMALEESSAESNMNYRSPKFKSFHRKNYQEQDQILFSSYLWKNVLIFCTMLRICLKLDWKVLDHFLGRADLKKVK